MSWHAQLSIRAFGFPSARNFGLACSSRQPFGIPRNPSTIARSFGYRTRAGCPNPHDFGHLRTPANLAATALSRPTERVLCGFRHHEQRSCFRFEPANHIIYEARAKFDFAHCVDSGNCIRELIPHTSPAAQRRAESRRALTSVPDCGSLANQVLVTVLTAEGRGPARAGSRSPDRIALIGDIG